MMKHLYVAVIGSLAIWSGQIMAAPPASQPAKSPAAARAAAVTPPKPVVLRTEAVPQAKIEAIWKATPQRQREQIELAYKGLKVRSYSAEIRRRLSTEVKEHADPELAKKRGQLKSHRMQALDPFLLETLMCSYYLNQDIATANEFFDMAIAQNERFLRESDGFAVDQHAGGPAREAWIYLQASEGGQWPGRLSPDLQKRLLKYMFAWVYRNSEIAYPRAPRPENVWLDQFEGIGNGSENHRTTKWNALFLVLKALAADPAYAERTLEDGATVRAHFEAWTDYLEYRVREWAKKGLFGEFGKASGYGLGHIVPLYALHDFAPTPELRQLAGQLLTLRLADWVMHMVGDGYIGGSIVRNYKQLRAQRYAQDYLYFAMGEADGKPYAIAAKVPFPSFSSYQPPIELVDLAWNRGAAGSYEYRMKPSGVIGWGTFFYGVDNVNLTDVRKEAKVTLGPTFPTPTLRYAYVTPSYVLGSFTQDPTRDPVYRPGVKAPNAAWSVGFQDIVMGATFANGTQLVPYCKTPDHSGFGEFYAVGDHSVLVAQRNPETRSGDLGVFVPIEMFKTRREEDGWVFASLPEIGVYAAIRSSKGGLAGWEPIEIKSEGPWDPPSHGQWLKFAEKNVPIVIQLGLASEHKSFEAFIAAVKARPFKWRSATEFEYAGCAPARPIVWNTNRRYLPMVGGVPINIYPPHVYHSPWLSSVYDSGVITLRDTTGRELILDFNKPAKK